VADARARQRDVAEDPPSGSGKPLAFVIFKGIESYAVVSDRPVMRGDLDAIELLLQAPEGTGLRGQEKRGDVRVLSGEDRSLARCSSANCSRTRPHASPSPSRRQLRLRPAPHLLHLAARRRRAQRAQRTDDGAQGHAHARSRLRETTAGAARARLLAALGRCSAGAVNTSGEGVQNGRTGHQVDDVTSGELAPRRAPV